MTRLLNSSLKRQKRLSAAEGDGPLRQCCACKKVLPKDKLMRLIKPQTENSFYDHSARMNGRGIYICPTAGCLEKTIKGKNSRRSFIKVDIEGFKEEIKSMIFYEIIKGMKLCCKMGYMQKSAEEPIDSKDYLIAGNDKMADSQKLFEKARMFGIKIFNVQGKCGDTFIETAIVKGSWPMHEKMLRNLERFQSLSFRGAGA
jgi:predicted RNA-binding protein YlxR (DUF448 family)